MRLVSLVIFSSVDDEIIRTIKFNEKGLSLIVDETNSERSGSNIGKTTAVKIIDLCLGAKSVSSIYKEKDTGENLIVKNFIDKRKVAAELSVSIDNQLYTFKRALYKNGRNEINGEIIKNLSQYREKINNIIFLNTNNKPTLRQLISKFVRLDNSNENALLKYLGTYTKNYEYQAIYNYLYGLDKSKSQNVEIISFNEHIDKDIEAIFRKNGVATLVEFETKIELMKGELEKFRREYREVTVIEDYESKMDEMNKLLTRINKLEELSIKETLKVNLMKDKIDHEKERIFLVDNRILTRLYDETKGSVESSIRDFVDLQKFHNGMVEKRLEILYKDLAEKTNTLEKVNSQLSQLRKVYETNFVSFNTELKDKFEEKYTAFSVNKVNLEAANNDYQYIINMQKKQKQNLESIVNENYNLEEIESVKSILNKYFKVYTKQIVGEPFALVFTENDEEFPVKIIGMNGKPGTGIKKAMISCFDLAHISLIIEKNYHMPKFEIHDKMENIDLVELKNIIDVARKFDGQYVFPILNDRIEKLEINEDEVVLRLSAEDKLFHI